MLISPTKMKIFFIPAKKSRKVAMKPFPQCAEKQWTGFNMIPVQYDTSPLFQYYHIETMDWFQYDNFTWKLELFSDILRLIADKAIRLLKAQNSLSIRAINSFINYILCFRLANTIQSDMLLQYLNSKFFFRLVITTRAKNFLFHFPLEFEFKGFYSNWNCEPFVQIWIWI